MLNNSCWRRKKVTINFITYIIISTVAAYYSQYRNAICSSFYNNFYNEAMTVPYSNLISVY